MALSCVEKIISLVIILIIFSLIFNSKSENFACPCAMRKQLGKSTCPYCQGMGDCSNCPYCNAFYN